MGAPRRPPHGVLHGVLHGENRTEPPAWAALVPRPGRGTSPAKIWGLLLLSLLPLGCSGNGRSPSRRRVAWLRDALVRSEDGAYGEAFGILKRGLSEHPDDPEMLNRFALAARLRYDATSEDDYRDQELLALRAARAALSRYPAPTRLRTAILVNLGTTLWEMGMRKESAARYREALRWAPHHPDAAEIWERARQADAAPEDGAVDK